MKKLFIGILVTVLILTTIACSGKSTSEDESLGYDSYRQESSGSITSSTAPDVKLEIPPAEYDTGEETAYPPVIIDLSESTADRMIVRTGNIDIVVEDVQVTIEDITQLAESVQGFVVSSNTWRSGNALYGTISIRVPADSYYTVLKIVRDTAIEVNAENTSASDVTEEYVDLQAKLKNLEATEQQLLLILEKATTVEDILKVQSQLSITRSEIERTKGSILYIERTTETSLLRIDLQQSKLYAEIVVNRSVVEAREPVHFYAEISGGFSPFSYQWDFGDGATSTNSNPVHSYKSTGDYTIMLTVTDDRGNTVTSTRENYINVLTSWEAGNTVQSAWNGLQIFGQVLVNILIWLGIFSPIWIIGGGIGFYFWRRNRKKKAAQKDQPITQNK